MRNLETQHRRSTVLAASTSSLQATIYNVFICLFDPEVVEQLVESLKEV